MMMTSSFEFSKVHFNDLAICVLEFSFQFHPSNPLEGRIYKICIRIYNI